MVREVRTIAFPELANVEVRLRSFSSDTDYFQARFSIPRFLFSRRMRYLVLVNSSPATITAPVEGRRAILAHELAHISFYSMKNRIHLFGLVRLTSGGFREHFEKRADAEAVRRGYAEGLKEYRLWLYRHVPGARLAEKKRDYLSPEGINELVRDRMRK